jgi:hypothetical protein
MFPKSLLAKGFSNVTSVGGEEVFMTVINPPPGQCHDNCVLFNTLFKQIFCNVVLDVGTGTDF